MYSLVYFDIDSRARDRMSVISVSEKQSRNWLSQITSKPVGNAVSLSSILQPCPCILSLFGVVVIIMSTTLFSSYVFADEISWGAQGDGSAAKITRIDESVTIPVDVR